MKLSDAREAYYDYSKSLSDINRKLGFAGIALIWLFREDSQGKTRIPPHLWLPVILIVLALSLDFLQYVWASLAWGVFSRYKETKGLSKDSDFHAPDWINWPTLFFFWLKITSMTVAYCLLIRHLVGRLS